MSSWLATRFLVEMSSLSSSELEAGLLALVLLLWLELVLLLWLELVLLLWLELVLLLWLELVSLLWRGKLQRTLSLELHSWWYQLGSLCMPKYQTKLQSTNQQRKASKTFHRRRIDQHRRKSNKMFVLFVCLL